MTRCNRPAPQPRCEACYDWGTLINPVDQSIYPCPNPIHQRTTTTPVTGPSAGEALETDRRTNPKRRRGMTER